MQPFSIVIICKNEAHVIGLTLQSLQGLTDDIIVYDNGSTDGTQEITRTMGVKLHEGNWEGFGRTKNKANSLAKYDWILSLDADEGIDEELKQSLSRFQPENNSTVYSIRFKNFLGEKLLKYGEWGTDSHIRLFNRQQAAWNEAAVHESLELKEGTVIRKINGNVLHRTIMDLEDYSRKIVHYAMLGAQKYFEQGKKPSWIKLRLSPQFNFLKFYLMKRGFLDGYEGYVSARMTAWYTFMKYSRLKELWLRKKKKDF